jgi:hypothetical protein
MVSFILPYPAYPSKILPKKPFWYFFDSRWFWSLCINKSFPPEYRRPSIYLFHYLKLVYVLSIETESLWYDKRPSFLFPLLTQTYDFYFPSWFLYHYYYQALAFNPQSNCMILHMLSWSFWVPPEDPSIGLWTSFLRQCLYVGALVIWFFIFFRRLEFIHINKEQKHKRTAG